MRMRPAEKARRFDAERKNHYKVGSLAELRARAAQMDEDEDDEDEEEEEQKPDESKQ